MNGSWVVRFLFIAAISSLVFGLSGDNQSISTNVPNDEGAAFSPEGFDEATVKKVLKMVNTTEYKRHQTPPILRVSSKAFGTGRRMPIVGKYLA